MPRKPGPGRPPTNLRAVVGYRPVLDSEGNVTSQAPVTVIERVEETIRWGGFLKDAAARIGVDVTQLRTWRTTGNRCAREILEGRRRRSQMSPHERLCVELADRIDKAEAEARIRLLGRAEQLASGGLQRTEKSRKVNAAGQVIEETTKVVELLPDPHMIQWLLSHRWPGDFGGVSKVELSGPDGGAIPVDAGPVVDRVRDRINQVRENRAETSPEAIEAALSSGSNGANGANGDHP